MTWKPDVTWSHDYWPKEQHDYIMELIRADHGGVLPDWALAVDLVYRADEANHPSKPVPWAGRRRLQEDWAVSERVTRRMLKSTGWQEKCDGARIPVPTRLAESDPDGDEVVPATVPTTVPRVSPPPYPNETNEPEQSPENVPATVPTTVPRAYHERPHPPLKQTELSLFSSPSVLLSYCPTDLCSENTNKGDSGAGQQEAPPAPPTLVVLAKQPDHFPEALSVWNVEIVEAIRSRGGIASTHPRTSRTSALGKPLVQRLRQHGLPAVLVVFRWLGTSNHPRAVFLRQQGCGLKTVLSPSHFEEYLGFAQAPPVDAASLGAPPARPQRRLDATEIQSVQARVRQVLQVVDVATARAQALSSTKFSPEEKSEALKFLDSIPQNRSAVS